MSTTTKKTKATDEKYFNLVKAFPLRPIDNEKQNDIAGEICGDLALKFDKLSPGEKDYLAVLSVLVENFESKWNDQDEIEPRELVTFLMEQNSLNQKDLIPTFGTSSRVSEYLNGHRELSINQVLGLAKRFNLSPAAFLPTRK